MRPGETMERMRRDMRVHPAAEVFPMLDDEALAELAEDIRENGLRVPIVVDRHGTLIDGRNRLAVCRMAAVEPKFQTFDGGDVEYFIILTNVRRQGCSTLIERLCMRG